MHAGRKESLNLRFAEQGLPLRAVRRAANLIQYSCQWQLYHEKWSWLGAAETEEGRCRLIVFAYFGEFVYPWVEGLYEFAQVYAKFDPYTVPLPARLLAVSPSLEGKAFAP